MSESPRIYVFDYPTVVWRLVSKEPPRISAHKLYVARNKTAVIALHLCSWQYGLYSFKFLLWAPKTHAFWNRLRNGCSRSSKVIDFGTNRLCVCNFLFNSNLGPSRWSYFPPFHIHCRFFAENSEHTPIPPEFRVFPLDYRLSRCCACSEVRMPKANYSCN